jgi:hypothetical protein
VQPTKEAYGPWNKDEPEPSAKAKPVDAETIKQESRNRTTSVYVPPRTMPVFGSSAGHLGTSFGAATPSFGAATPSFGAAAPSFGAAAPSFGASTFGGGMSAQNPPFGKGFTSRGVPPTADTGQFEQTDGLAAAKLPRNFRVPKWDTDSEPFKPDQEVLQQQVCSTWLVLFSVLNNDLGIERDRRSHGRCFDRLESRTHSSTSYFLGRFYDPK